MQNEYAAVHFSCMHQTAGFEEKTTLLQGVKCIMNAANIGNLVVPEEIPKEIPLGSSSIKPGGQRTNEGFFLLYRERRQPAGIRVKNSGSPESTESGSGAHRPEVSS